ncbi:MAG: hypothetical protein EBR82_89290, partial [Caulobacteraceae bacterium]|nr:hypothetical protein [Caulobacteraceae bacterium]
MRLTSIGLGIGTSTPDTKLTLGGSGHLLSLTNPSSSVANGIIRWKNSSGTTQAFIGSYVNIANTGNLEFGNGSTTTMNLDSSGNLGLGVTPSAWSASYKALSIGFTGGGQFAGGTVNTQTLLSANLVFTGTGSTGWKLPNNVAGTNYEQYLGAHKWYYAPANGVDGDASLTQAMTLDASGNLLVGTTSLLANAS